MGLWACWECCWRPTWGRLRQRRRRVWSWDTAGASSPGATSFSRLPQRLVPGLRIRITAVRIQIRIQLLFKEMGTCVRTREHCYYIFICFQNISFTVLLSLEGLRGDASGGHDGECDRVHVGSPGAPPRLCAAQHQGLSQQYHQVLQDRFCHLLSYLVDRYLKT